MLNHSQTIPLTKNNQIIIGAGQGLSLIQPQNVIQTVLNREDIPTGVTIVTTAQFLGGTVFVPVCQSILSNTLRSQLASKIPGLDTAKIAQSGATEIAQLVSKEQLPVLLAAYNKGIVNIFYCALAMACAAFVASGFLGWKSMKKDMVVKEAET